jgi:hypothetical protein
MKIIVCAASVFLFVMPFRALAKDQCDFDLTAVAQQLSAKAQKIPGATQISPSEFLWVEASGRKIQIGYGGCVDLGVEVSVSKPVGSGAPLTQDDLVRAVARYWSATNAKSLGEALAGGRGDVRANGNVRVIEFGPDVSDAFPFGFTVSLSPNHVAASWQEL